MRMNGLGWVIVALGLVAGAAHAAEVPPQWQVVSGAWSYDNGQFLQSRYRPSETYCFLREPVLSDLTFSARFFVYPDGSGVKAAGLAFRSISSAECYFAHFDAKYGQMIFYLQHRDGFKELARVRGLKLALNEWHEGKITAVGPKLSVFLDGKLISEVTDSTYTTGRVGLRVGQGKVAFDSVTQTGTVAKLDKEWVVMSQSVKPDEDGVPQLTAAERIIAERGGGYFPVLIRLFDGRLMAVVRGGDSHVGIKGRLDIIESADGGKTWSAPHTAVDSAWDDRNPSLGQMPNGTIVLGYAECQAYNDKQQYDTKAGGFHWKTVLSKDGGKTWSEPRPLTHGPIGFVSSPYGRIIVSQDGTALMSVYGNVNPDYQGPDKLPAGAGPWVCGLLRSQDNGETWGDFSLISGKGYNETTVLEMPDKTLLAAMRTTGGMVDLSRSTDGGRSWSDPVPVTGGPNRSKGQHPADLCLLQSGALLMVFGNRVEPFGAEAILSEDGGRTWGYDKRVMLGWTSLNTDCGYPSAVQLPDGTIVCVYYSVATEELPDAWQCLAVRFTEQQLRAAAP